MLKQIVRMQLAATAVTLALGVGTAAKADDVTLTVWSHEADEPATVALREKAASQHGSQPSGRPRQDHLVREGRPLRGAQDRACRPDRVRMSSTWSPTRPTTSPAATSCRSTTWSTGTTSMTGRGRCGPMTARSGACRRRPTRSSSTTTRTRWRSSASRCRPTPSSRSPSFSTW